MMSRFFRLVLIWVLIAYSPGNAASLFAPARGFKPTSDHEPATIVPIKVTPPDMNGPQPARAPSGSGSLFADRRAKSMFAPVERVARPKRTSRGSSIPKAIPFDGQVPAVAALRNLIAKVEAGSKQYDAVVYSAKIKTPKPPTRMTIAEIYKWIEDTPGQNHAIGRYQFIPKTLRGLVKKLGLPGKTKFSPAVQDRLANVLLEEAGYSQFRAGGLPRKAFMNNLARIWAGLPNSTGKSHYAGIAGNKAGMSWARFQTEMNRIFPVAVPPDPDAS